MYTNNNNCSISSPLEWFSCPGKDWIILTVEIKTKHPVGGPFSCELSAFVIIAELLRPEVARPRNLWAIFAFFGKTTPYDKIFKILFRNFTWRHRSTLLCWNVAKFCRREIAEIARYSCDLKHFWLPIKLSLLRRSRPKSARSSPLHLAHNVPNLILIGSRSAEL